MICNVCTEDKTEDEFNFRDKQNGKRQRYCRECDSKRRKASYHKHSKRVKHDVIGRTRLEREKFQQWKQLQCCQVCGEDATECLDLHHTDPTKKDFNISNWRAHNGGKRLWDEVAKCVVLCANCHRKVHSGRIECPCMPPVFETGES